MDVLEIDAATNTRVDKVREVIIAGLGIAPVRNRYKIFIIDEVHRLSKAGVRRAPEVDRGAAAARRLHDGDDRAREGPGDDPVAIAGLRAEDDRRQGDRRPAPPDRRRRESIAIDDAALTLVARAGDGSMRDAQSALRPGDRVRRRTDRCRRCVDGARAGAPRPAVRDRARRSPREDGAAGIRSGGDARSSPATISGWSSASWRA